MYKNYKILYIYYLTFISKKYDLNKIRDYKKAYCDKYASLLLRTPVSRFPSQRPPCAAQSLIS